MEICPSDKCTGCAACQNICPHDGISMKENQYGELHPEVDKTKCKNCTLCINICPINNQPVFNYPSLCYASWITDIKKRRICASGGIGTVMAEYVINKLNGITYGSRYDDNLTPIMTSANTVEQLERFKGSRYVQSIVSNTTYKEVLTNLKSGKKVLFIGTPCQIAGLKAYVKNDYENLITVDLICHGCAPTEYFNKEVKYICQRNKLSGITDIRFRGNDNYNYCFSFWKNNCENNHYEYMERASESYYLSGFLLGVTLRENCYSCSYARPERISDITIGDFIGLGQQVPFDHSTTNVSSVMINTEKGKSFYDGMSKNTPELINVVRNYQERLVYKPSLTKPSTRHKLNSIFREEYLRNGYTTAIRKTLGGYVRRQKAKRIISLPWQVARLVWTNAKRIVSNVW